MKIRCSYFVFQYDNVSIEHFLLAIPEIVEVYKAKFWKLWKDFANEITEEYTSSTYLRLKK